MPRVRVKICGITRVEDALVAAQAGADFLGFVFYPKSPRYVPVERAAAIVAAVRKALAARAPRFVGVFVNASPEQVQATLHQAGLDLAQLHGEEPPEMFQALWPRAYKALRPATVEEALTVARRYAQDLAPQPDQPLFLVDAHHPTAYGGTGLPAHEAAARALAERYPILLAGGLNPKNVAEKITRLRPWGVDVSSGVEARPGIKDPERIRAFLRAVREARLD